MTDIRSTDCLILHPQRDMEDILMYTGIVRYTYETFKGRVTLFVLPEFNNLLKNHYADLEQLRIERIADLSDSTFLKLFIGKYKNSRNRYFFGLSDKFRIDNYKKKATSDDFDPYTFYDFDPEIKYKYFRINMNEERRSKLMFQIKTVANMNYNMTSKAEYVPVQYKKNAMVSLNVDTMFNNSNFFDATELLKHSKALYLTNSDKDYFTLLIYMMVRAGVYEEVLPKKNVYLFNMENEPLKYENLPDYWKIV